MVGPPASLPIALVFRVEFMCYYEIKIMGYLKLHTGLFKNLGRIGDLMRTITVLNKKEYNEWIALFKETGVNYSIENRSDYSGFEVKLTWKE